LAAARKLILEDLQANKIKLAYEPWTEEDKAALQEYQEFQAQPWPEDFEEAMALSEQKDESHKAFKETRAYSMRQLEKDIQAAEDVLALGDEYDRSVIKRNAMTYAYSSRQFGFADQLRSDWMNDFTKEVRQNKREKHPFGKDRGYHAAFYLAGIHEKAIEQTVRSAAAGMKFLQDVGVILAVDASEDDIAADKKRNFNGRHFRFENVMGFPFFQYYRKGSTKKQKVSFWDREAQLYDKKNQSYYRRYSDRVDVDKVRNGISPNTIHSQDGCHLLMTALALKDEGVTSFMVVHDSFATTIADCNKLDEILRKQFIDQYSDYCLFEDVLEQAKARHSNPNSVEWPAIPKKGHLGQLLDLSEILNSEYFFN